MTKRTSANYFYTIFSPCHSLIFDPWDETWSQYFTEDELDEIISYNKPNTLPLPLPLQEYIDKFIHTVCLFNG